MNAMFDTHSDDRTVLDAGVFDRIEPLRRTLERLEPAARAHFVEGLRILAEEIDAYDDRSPG